MCLWWFTPGSKKFLLLHLPLSFNTCILSLNSINDLSALSSLIGIVMFHSLKPQVNIWFQNLNLQNF